MKNLWEVWSCALPAAWCDHIIDRVQSYPAHNATVGHSDGGFKEDHGYRRSTVRWLDKNGADHDVADKIMRYIRSSNRTNFGFDIWDMNDIQYTEYHAENEGHYDWHHDVFFENPQPHDRKLSVVIQMSDPKDYDGGKFEFYRIASPGAEFLMKGSILIFPSFYYHRVMPVTRGVRRSLVSWIEGPKFK
jgi:PKHD-type hydroxylase